jgi:Amt family ammonium transporter
MLTECYVRGRPSLLGMVSGSVAGLVAITPCAGYVDFTGAFFIGLLAGPVCFGGAKLKHWFGYDDALDAFGVHAVGGVLGGVMLGFFANDEIAPVNGIFYSNNSSGGHQLGLQLYGIVVCAGWSLFMSTVLLLAIDHTIGLRVSEQEEDEGLDLNLHGETIILEREMYIKKRASVMVSVDDAGRPAAAYSSVPHAGVAEELAVALPPSASAAVSTENV